MGDMGKLLTMIGVVLLILGGFMIIGEKLGFGKLPGDIFIEKGNFTFFFPIVSCIIISIILTIILNLINR